MIISNNTIKKQNRFFSELERGSITKSALNQQYVYVLQMLELLKNLDAYLDYSYVRGKGEVC